MGTQTPPIEYLNQCVSYCEDTGVIRWLLRPLDHFQSEREWKRWNSRYAGKVAGLIDRRGYRRIKIDCHRYKAHRLIWKLMTGDDPRETIDHVDGVTGNNSWNNLRKATQQQQTFNSHIRKDNPTGHRGVDRRGKKWRAYIKLNGVRHELGRFNSVDGAAAAYEAAARKFHGEFYRDEPRR